MDTPSLTPFLLFLVGSKPMMYAALCCIYKNIIFGSGKLKFLVFQIPSHKKQNKKERTTLPSSPFRGTTKIDL